MAGKKSGARLNGEKQLTLSEHQRDYLLRFAEVYRVRGLPTVQRQAVARSKMLREES